MFKNESRGPDLFWFFFFFLIGLGFQSYHWRWFKRKIYMRWRNIYFISLAGRAGSSDECVRDIKEICANFGEYNFFNEGSGQHSALLTRWFVSRLYINVHRDSREPYITKTETRDGFYSACMCNYLRRPFPIRPVHKIKPDDQELVIHQRGK